MAANTAIDDTAFCIVVILFVLIRKINNYMEQTYGEFMRTNALIIELPKGWNDVNTDTPPNELLKVIDKNGKKGFATPTYYPFKVGQSNGGKWTSPIIPCEPYWDGGWLISVPKGKLESNLEKIVGWKKY